MVDRHRTGFDSLCPAISGGLAPDEGQKGAAGCFRRYLDSIPDAERLPLRQIEQGRAGIDRVEEQKAWDSVPGRPAADQRWRDLARAEGRGVGPQMVGHAHTRDRKSVVEGKSVSVRVD